MNQEELNTILNNLIANWEDEVTEFKQAKKDYSTDDIGKYFSALANEANLRELPKGWLVFGVNNKTRSVVGTDYREDYERLQSLKMQIAKVTASKAEYIKMRAQDDEHYIKLVTDFIKKFGKATREDIDKLLNGKLSDALDEGQKVKKVGNLLTKMRRSEVIYNKGSRTAPEWMLAERMQKENS